MRVDIDFNVFRSVHCSISLPSIPAILDANEPIDVPVDLTVVGNNSALRT